MDSLPKYLQNRLNPTTRSRSKKQEDKIKKDFLKKGKSTITTINSGATFGQNDIISEDFEIEAKTTSKGSFTIKKDYWSQIVKKTQLGKLPVMVIDFEGSEEVSLAVINYQDLLALIDFNK